MTTALQPGIEFIKAVFTEEIKSKKGTVTDCHAGGESLFMRSTLDHHGEARPGDGLRGGVSLRVFVENVCVRPYVFRLMCRNGAIIAQSLQARQFDRVVAEPDGPEILPLEFDLRTAIGCCAQEESWREGLEVFQRSAKTRIDGLFAITPLLRRMSRSVGRGLWQQILARMNAERDETAFGVMNAITSLARDTNDPETRWQLEELGGGVPAMIRPRPMPAPTRAFARDPISV